MIVPRRHQLEYMTFHRACKLLGTMAWHGMGLGKTLSALWLGQEHVVNLRKMGVMAPKVLVLCPKSAVTTWKVECHKHLPGLLPDLIVQPYSQLHNVVKSLKHMDIRFLICDESHYLKDPSTDRMKYFAAFLTELGTVTGRFHLGRVILATGTPLPNGAQELYTSWAICGSPNVHEAAKRLLDPMKYEDWKVTFAQRKDINWVVGKNKPKGQQKKGHATKWEGVANEDMLQQLLAPFVHYRRVEDCIDLPDALEIEIDLELEDDKLLKDANIEKPEAYMAIVERLSRAKTPHMISWVRDFLVNSDEQLLVFAMNRHPIETLMEEFPKQFKIITGSESQVERAEILRQFQTGQLRGLGLTYACGAESLNLQNAWVSLYHGYPWNDAKRRQAMARTRRSGQARKTRHYFMMSGQNDRHILGLVKSKGETERKVEDLLLGDISHVKGMSDWSFVGAEKSQKQTVDDFI